jgi:hypothetical protein
MKILGIVGLALIVSAVAYIGRGLLRDPDLGGYYAPTLLQVPQTLSISIPVEIEKKQGKASFVELFKVYGFSGNGPSIEQVVSANTKIRSVRYDSEGGAFVVIAPDQETYLQVLRELDAVTQVQTLNAWLRKAAWTPIKE